VCGSRREWRLSRGGGDFSGVAPGPFGFPLNQWNADTWFQDIMKYVVCSLYAPCSNQDLIPPPMASCADIPGPLCAQALAAATDLSQSPDQECAAMGNYVLARHSHRLRQLWWGPRRY
jgi:hypothetical protein